MESSFIKKVAFVFVFVFSFHSSIFSSTVVLLPSPLPHFGGQAFGTALIMQGTSNILTTHTNLSPEVKQIISLSAVAVSAFVGGGFNAGSLQGAISGFKSALPFLSRELASSGLLALGSSLGLDPRLTSLLSIPVSAGFGGGVRGGLSNTQTIFDGIKAGLKNSGAGFISASAQLGLGELGVSGIVSSTFLPALLSGLVGVGGQTGNNQTNPTGEGLFSLLKNTALKFAKDPWAVGRESISFAQRLLEGAASSVGTAIEKTKAGFAKAVDYFSGIFDRKTQESLIKAGNGNIEGFIKNNAFFENGKVSIQIDGQKVVWDETQGQLRVTDDYGSYMELIQPAIAAGVYLYESLVRKEKMQEIEIIQSYNQDNQLQSVEVLKGDKPMFQLSAEPGSKVEIDANGKIINGVMSNRLGHTKIRNAKVYEARRNELISSDTFLNEDRKRETDIWIQAAETYNFETGQRSIEINPETWAFVGTAYAAGAEVGTNGGVTFIKMVHDSIVGGMQFAANFLQASYEHFSHTLRFVAETDQAVHEEYKDGTKWLLDQFELNPPSTEVRTYGKIAVVDMDLPWIGRLSTEKKGAVQALGDIFVLLDRALQSVFSHSLEPLENSPFNRRWARATNHAAPYIAEQIRSTANDFVFVPGVNSSGPTPSELEILRERFGIAGKKTVMCHSAGTEACLNAI